MNPLKTIDKLKRDYTDFLRASFPISTTLPFLSNALAQVVDREGDLFKGPYLELTPPYRQGATPRKLVAEGVLHPKLLELSSDRLPPDRPLYLHQEQSIRTARAGGNVCVAAGTGSGKTECFLIPIIDYILRLQEHGSVPGVKAVLMYPMNALVEDQLARLRQLLGNKVGQSITFGRYTGLTKETEVEFQNDLRERGIDILPNEVGSRERLREALPDILMTNFSMLQYLLLRPRDRSVFEGTDDCLWRFLVLDEVHTYRGVQGIEVGMLLRRFMDRVNRLSSGMQCFATSATLSSSPEDEMLLVQFLQDVFSHSFSGNSGMIIRGQAVAPQENRYYDVPAKEMYSITEDKLLEIPANFFDRELADFAALSLKDVATQIMQTLFAGTPPIWLECLVGQCKKTIELLFEVGRRNRDIHRLVEALTAEPVLSVQELTKRLHMSSSEAVRRLIRLGTMARPSTEAHPLVSARYHFFIRGPQGARVCLNENCSYTSPADDNLLANRTTLTGAETCACGHALYEVGICRNCGQPYIIGYMSPNGNGFYATRDDAGERVRRYLIPRAQINKSEYGCSREADIRFCTEAGDEVLKEAPLVEYNFVAQNEGGREIPTSLITKCFRCGEMSRATSDVVTSFASEGDIAQIVLLQSVLQAQGKTPKALVFSDSRQGAAKFAVNLNYTAKSALTRQLVLRLLAEEKEIISDVQRLRSQFPNATEEMVRAFLQQVGQQPERRKNELGLDDLGQRLRHSEEARSCGLFSDVDMDNDYDEEARARIYAEFGTMLNHRLNLCSLGLCKREIELPIGSDNTDIISLFRPLGISTIKDASNLLQLLLSTLLDQGVADRESREHEIRSQYSVLLPAAPYQNYIILDGSGQRAQSSEISWLPRGAKMRNSRMALLEKVAQENGCNLDSSALRQILTNTFVFLNRHKTFDQINGDHKSISLRRVRISRGAEVWECPTCGERSFFPVILADGKVLCPAKDCRGRMEPRSAPQADSGFFENLYLQESPIRLVAREHTAQLGEDSTRKYQDSFADEKSTAPNRINVLSCSTTFEMGVDLGDLSAVFMRNVPPEVANYRQRAGRAGRRSGQEAMIFTFARSRSHDAYYFSAPERMIAGDVRPPVLNMANPELRRRHMNAFFLADYLAYLELTTKTNLLLKDIWPLAELGIDPRGFKNWQDNRAPAVCISCAAFAASLEEKRNGVQLLAEFTEDIQKIGQGLVRQQNDMNRRRQQLSDKIKEARSDEEFTFKAIKREEKRLAEEVLIDFLVKNQVLPGFGFPVHVVELDTKADNLELTRDKSIALFEYAPGSTVVADGYAIPSVGLKNSYFREEEQFTYRICSECGHAEIHSNDGFEQHCLVCGADLDAPTAFARSPKKKMLVPAGFTSDTSSWPKKAGATIVPSYNRRLSFVRYKKGGAATSQHPMGVYTTCYASDAELYIINTGEPGGRGFRFCTSCRRLVPKGTSHDRPYGGKCHNESFDECIHLGHTFRTDAIRMRFAADVIPDLPSAKDLGFWRSLSYAVLKGAVIELQIERNDLGAIVQPYSAGADYGQEIILFDAVPGGAGYCRYFNSHERIEKIFQAALHIVSQCECDPDSSCHRCLRTYDNAAYHRQLRRGPVAEMLTRTLAVMKSETAFIPFGNATYYVARQLAQLGRQVSLAVYHLPFGSPQGERRSWVDLFTLSEKTRLMVARESLSRDWLASNPQAVSACRTMVNLLSKAVVELRAPSSTELPAWHVLCESDQESAAIALRKPDLDADNKIERWTYKRDEVASAMSAYMSVFMKAPRVTAADIEDLLAPIQFHEIPPRGLFHMRNGLSQYYSAGAKIVAAFMNDRYIVNCQFASLAEHLALIQAHGAVKDVPVLVYTETASDFSDRTSQRDYADEIKYRFANTSVNLYERYERKVEHQRFIVMAREDGSFSRLTMDPGIDVIDRYQRNAWPEGPVFQRTEIYYVQDYNPSGLHPDALTFLHDNAKR